MAISRPDEWAQFEVENVSLADILSTSGIDPEEAADSILSSSEGTARAAPLAHALALTADRPFKGVGAFAPADEAVSQVTAALPSLAPAAVVLEPIAAADSLTGRHVVAQQRIHGLNVVGSRVTLHFDAEGAYAVTGSPLGDLADRDPGRPPVMAEAEIRAHVQYLYPVADADSITLRQVAFPVDGGITWAWLAVTPVEEPRADVRVFLRADDLSILVSYVTTVASLFGEGMVYQVNPLRTPELHVALIRDIGPEPPDRLGGSALQVAGRPGDPLVNASRDWKLAPGDKGFDHVAAYHHVTEAYWYFRRLVHNGLFEGSPFTPLNVFVNDQQTRNNAFFFPDRGELALGDFGDRGDRPSARSAEMVFHEFGHAVTHGIARLADTNQQQARAVGEGYSDYFACSALGDPRFGDYVMNKPEGARNCAKQMDRFVGDRDTAKEHQLGEVWANVLWGIRSRLGAATADILAMESVHYLQPTPTLDRAHWALLEVDRILFPRDATTGQHADLIEHEWSLRL